MIHYWIDPAFGHSTTLIASTIEQLLEINGWKSQLIDSSEDAQIRYGPSTGGPGCLPCAGLQAWPPLVLDAPCWFDGLVVPSRAVVKMGDQSEAIDWILASFFFLSGNVERQPDCIEKPGIPGPGLSKWELDKVPTVSLLADRIGAFLLNLGFRPGQPRWPEGKTWAVCLSHDCDRPFRFRTMGFLRDSIAAGSSLRRRAFSLAKAAYAACHHWHLDPYCESWKNWLEFERAIGVHGVYFIGTWGTTDPQSGPYDLVYRCSDPGIMGLAAQCREFGAELGLHSGIEAWAHPGRFAQEVDRFRTYFKVAPEGFRAHYWSLRPDDPEESMASACTQTSFTYDSSLGMNQSPGFRRGIAYPFRPFSAKTGSYTGLVELPPTLMDGALFLSGKNSAQRRANLLSLSSMVRNTGGLMMLDWHSDSLWSSYMGNMTSDLLPILTEFASDSHCWFATAGEISEWCRVKRWQASALGFGPSGNGEH